jgi:two-component sensor histidine kinase
MPSGVVTRIGEIDLPDRLAPVIPRWVTQLCVALLCVAVGGVLRMVINVIAPGAAVFALVFPMIMIATLFARWQSGVVTAAISIIYAFYLIYLPGPTNGTEPSFTLFAVTAAAALTIGTAEIFRRAARQATQARDDEIADRDLMLAEFEHRVKNNFAIVASMLDLQRRRVGNEAAVEALTSAMTRVDSIARAHRHLYRDGQGSEVNVRDYLNDLCSALSEALLLRGGVTLDCDADAAPIKRDDAVSIGLVVNELVTNAAKHAFAGRETGEIHVSWKRRDEGGWRLTVADNGVGMPSGPRTKKREGGLGTRLIEAFARQAGGALTISSDGSGTRTTMEIPD